MRTTDRRSVIAGLGALAALSNAFPAYAVDTFAAREFQPPAGIVSLKRTLVRGLSDGNQIIVVRDWIVQFEPHPSGFRLKGHQSAVTVDAPKGLEALADIERARQESGFLPLAIDKLGLIDGGGIEMAKKGVDQAATAAMKIFEASDMDRAEKEAAGAFLQQIHASAAHGISKMPRDLFLPRQLAYSEQREFPLPGNEQGVLSVDFSARLVPSGRCLEQAKRRVTTRAAGQILTSEENWHLQE